jgi:hypothetical protein
MSWQLFQLDRSTDFNHKKCPHLCYLHSSDFINLQINNPISRTEFCNNQNTGYDLFLLTYAFQHTILVNFLQPVHSYLPYLMLMCDSLSLYSPSLVEVQAMKKPHILLWAEIQKSICITASLPIDSKGIAASTRGGSGNFNTVINFTLAGSFHCTLVTGILQYLLQIASIFKLYMNWIKSLGLIAQKDFIGFCHCESFNTYIAINRA